MPEPAAAPDATGDAPAPQTDGRHAAILLGGILLVWPAFLNGYPLVFSDTGGFLHQTLGPLMLWDKPWVYGPFLHLFHWRLTLWLPLAAQALIVSHLLWLAQRALRGEATAVGHIGTCLVAGALTTAPFTVAMLMPDVFAPAVVLALALLAFARPMLTAGETIWLMLLAAIGVAVHPAHLPLAAALLVPPLVARRWRDAARTALPVGAAVALVLATNAVGHGRIALSPNGATFLLARLQADGPAAEVIHARCPAAGWYLCAFAHRLPMPANEFLWAPGSPVNRDANGRPRFLGGALLAPEAGVIVGETLRAHPIEVAEAMLGNGTMQLVWTSIGDTLGNDNLAAALRPRIAEGFPPGELAAFEASLQARGELRPAVAWMVPLHLIVLGFALPLALAALWRDPASPRGWILLAVVVGLAANALATGGLSGVFPRYQARIAWLLPVAAMLLVLPPRRRA